MHLGCSGCELSRDVRVCPIGVTDWGLWPLGSGVFCCGWPWLRVLLLWHFLCDCFGFGLQACQWHGLVSSLLGDIHGGISKYLMFGLLPGGFLVEGGYQSSVAVVGFCASGRPMDNIWGSCTRDVEAVMLLAGIVCCRGFLIGETGTFGLWCLWGWF